MKDKLFPDTVTLEDGTTLRYRPIVKIKCMYCGLWATIAEFSDGSPGLVHPTPHCSEFQALDVLTFITNHRKKYQAEEKDYRPN